MAETSEVPNLAKAHASRDVVQVICVFEVPIAAAEEIYAIRQASGRSP